MQHASIASERSRDSPKNPSAALVLLELLGSALALSPTSGQSPDHFPVVLAYRAGLGVLPGQLVIDLYLPQNWATGVETFASGAVNALFLPLFLWLRGLKRTPARRLVYVLAPLVLVIRPSTVLSLFWAQAGPGVSLTDAISTYADGQ